MAGERKVICLRLSDAGIGWLGEQAAQRRITRSDVIRECLRFAQQNEWTFTAWVKQVPHAR